VLSKPELYPELGPGEPPSRSASASSLSQTLGTLPTFWEPGSTHLYPCYSICRAPFRT